MASRVRVGEVLTWLYAVVAVASFTSGPVFTVRQWWPSTGPLAEDAAVIVWLSGLQAIAGLLLWRRRPTLARGARVGVVAAAVFGGWLMLASWWSDSPGVTLVRSAQLAITPLFGWWLFSSWADVRRLVVLWLGLHVGVAWSAWAVWSTRPGSQDARGDWTGVYFNRNSLAPVVVLGALVSVALIGEVVRRWRPRDLVIAGGLVAALLLDVRLALGAGSRTSPGIAVAAVLVAGVVLGLRRSALSTRRIATASLAVGGLGLAAAWIARGAWLSLFDRDRDFTGRATVWSVVTDWAGRRPFTGYGYLTLWRDPAFQAAQETVNRGASLSSAHNSALEALLGGGWPALAALAVAVAASWSSVVAATPRRAGLAVATWVVVWVFAAGLNVLETFVVPHSLVWTLVAGATAWSHASRDDDPDRASEDLQVEHR